ncbi:MAG: histidine phosphatase family protein [Cyanobacteria bacterium J06559_3]
MSLCVYLLRHGETESSKTGGYCGSLNPELTPEGQQMAQAFADRYQSFPWQAVYVSPMKRTIATAKPLCEATGMDMEIRDGIREIEYGEWEGKTREAVQAQYGDDYIHWLTEPAWNPPTGGETSIQISSRANLVMAEIEEKYTTGNVLVVSHKATIRIILCSLLGIDLGRYRDRINLPVASVSVIQFDIHGPMLVRHGDRSHLPEVLAQLPGT